MIRSFSLTAFAVGALILAPVANAQTRPAGTTAAQAPTVDEATRTFRAWDKNGDGQLTMAEFSEGFKRAQATVQAAANLRRQFAAIDANHSGAIDPTEYPNLVLIKNAGRNAPSLSRFDGNGNGKLEFNEYVKLVEALSPRPQAQPAARGQGRR